MQPTKEPSAPTEESAAAAADTKEPSTPTEEPAAAAAEEPSMKEPAAAAAAAAAETKEPSAPMEEPAAAAAETEEPSVPAPMKEPAAAAAASVKRQAAFPIFQHTPWSMRRVPSNEKFVRMRVFGQGYDRDVLCRNSVQTDVLVILAFNILDAHIRDQEARRAELEKSEWTRQKCAHRNELLRQGIQLRFSSNDYDFDLLLPNDVPCDPLVNAMLDIMSNHALPNQNTKTSNTLEGPKPGLHMCITGLDYDFNVRLSNDLESDIMVCEVFKLMRRNAHLDLNADDNLSIVSQDVQMRIINGGYQVELWIFNKDQPAALTTATLEMLSNHFQKVAREAQQKADLARAGMGKTATPPTTHSDYNHQMEIAGKTFKLKFGCEDAVDTTQLALEFRSTIMKHVDE